MHEYTIARSAADLAFEELRRRRIPPERLRVVRLAVGRMHQVLEDSLVTLYALLVEPTPAAASRLEIRSIPVRFRCRACAAEQEARPPVFRCDACGSGDVEITAGRELHLESIEVEDETAPPGEALPGAG